MKARKRDSNDEWKDIVYVQLRDSYCLTSADQVEFQHDNLSAELKTYDQADEEKHWQDVRERAAIAALQGMLANQRLYGEDEDYYASRSVEIANALVEQLKGE